MKNWKREWAELRGKPSLDQRGWSTVLQRGPRLPAAMQYARTGFVWNERESADVLAAWQDGLSLAELAYVHARSPHAIATHLNKLGVADLDFWAARPWLWQPGNV